MSNNNQSPYWTYLPEWAGWWVMFPGDRLTSRRGYGPFTEAEAQVEGEVHGVPFLRPSLAMGAAIEDEQSARCEAAKPLGMVDGEMKKELPHE